VLIIPRRPPFVKKIIFQTVTFALKWCIILHSI